MLKNRAALDVQINVFHQDQGKQLSRGTFLRTSLLKGTLVSEGHGACGTGSRPCGLECSFPAAVSGWKDSTDFMTFLRNQRGRGSTVIEGHPGYKELNLLPGKQL